MASRSRRAHVSRLLLPAAVTVIATMLGTPSTAGAALSVDAAGPAPFVLPAGGKLEVKASAKGGSGKLSLVLSSSATSATGGTLLAGKGATVRRSAKGTRVRGSLPADLPAGQTRFVLVCTSGAKAITGGKASCKSAGQAPTSTAGLAERLAAATAAGRLSQGKAALYTLYAANADPRLPAELRGATTSGESTEELIHSALLNVASYPRSIRRELAWYFAPPSAPGSPWRQKRGNKKPKKAVSIKQGKRASVVASAAQAQAQADCAGFSALSGSPYAGKYAAPWVGLPTSDGKAIVWYQDGENDAKKSAELYAAEFPGIWNKLTAEFGEPKSDKGTDCYFGPDGRFDVYVNGATTFLAGGGVGVKSSGQLLAGTMPYPAATGKWCTNRPAWITIKPGQPRFTLAHEFMHALQFAHQYASCDEPLGWWDEGSANWAADFVYPGDNDERPYATWTDNPLGNDEFAWSNYRAYPFWMFLQRTYGTGVLRSIFAQLKTKTAVAAVDAAIPGGFAEQWPRFAVQLWNRSPIGSPGFPIKESFGAWDAWPFSIPIPTSPEVVLDGAKEQTFDLPIQNSGAVKPLSVAAYHHVFVRDDEVREIKFTNKLKGSAPGHVQAMVRLKTGEWRLKDWTGQDPVLCRNNPEEDVQELVIVSTNAGPTGAIPSFTHQLRARNACERPTFRIVGYTERIYSETPQGDKERIDTYTGTPGDPRTVDPCPDGYCEPEPPTTEFETRVTTRANGSVTGPPSSTCPGGQYTYPEQVLDNPGRLRMTFDPRGETGDATVTESPDIASVGDVNIGICGAYTTGRDATNVTATVPRAQVLSGQPFTFSLSRAATIASDPFSASPTISYAWSKTVTMVRVNEDGSPYGT